MNLKEDYLQMKNVFFDYINTFFMPKSVASFGIFWLKIIFFLTKGDTKYIDSLKVLFCLFSNVFIQLINDFVIKKILHQHY